MSLILGRLREWRSRKGWTQPTLSAVTRNKVSVRSIGRYESGEGADPDMAALLAKAFGCPVEDLQHWDGHPRSRTPAAWYIERYKIEPVRPPRACTRKIKVVAFDADGTIVQGPGYLYSWYAIDFHLGMTLDEAKEGGRVFLKSDRSLDAWTRWCNHSLRNYIRLGLRRSMMPEIVAPLRETTGLREVIDYLKANGVVTAVVSGGVGDVLRGVIPDVEHRIPGGGSREAGLFDYVFINEIVWDEEGCPREVRVSPFDFHRKLCAIEAVCEVNGLGLKDAAFVGDNFNDAAALDSRLGLSAAFCADTSMTDGADVVLNTNDLRELLGHLQ